LKRSLTTIALGAALGAASAGCGSDEDGGDVSGLTKYAPADSVLFVEGAVRPEGDLKDSIDSILGRFPDGDQLGGRLIDEIDQSAREDGTDFSWANDIEPWLGQRAAFYASGVEVKPSGAGESEAEPTAGALVVEVTDEGQAEESIRKLAESEGQLQEGSYEGVGYEVAQDPSSDDPLAFAVDDGIALIGNEQGLRDSIDASDGDNLSSQSDYTDFLDGADSDLYASLYVDGAGILESAGSSLDPQQRQSLEKAFGQYLEKPILGAVEVSEDEVRVEFSGAAGEVNAGEASTLLDAGFADSWLAAAIPSFGESFASSFGQASGAGLSEAEVNQFNAELESQLGFSLSDLEAVGDVAFFASGTSLVSLEIGGLIQVSDAAVRDRLMAAIRSGARGSGQGKVRPLSGSGGAQGFSISVPDLPAPVNVLASGEQIAIGIGPATDFLLSGEGGLNGSQGFGDATEALGEGTAINFLLEFAPIVELVDSTGQADSDFEQARPYLEAFDLIAAGTERDGDRATSRFVVIFSD